MRTKIRDYKVLEKIGKGGMSLVYRADHSILERKVVIKEFKDTPGDDRVERFKREARVTALLHHSNIVDVYDFFSLNSTKYLVMENVDGEDLKKILTSANRVPPIVAAAIIWSVLDALEYAHSREILHRDIKPSNILVSKEGEVKLADFGIAKQSIDEDLTTAGTLLGTPAYMSPEQAAGSEATYLSDIYAVGVTLYELITGEKPFVSSDTQTLIQRIIQGDYDQPRKLNPSIGYRLNHIIKKSMQTNPNRRYRSASEMKKSVSRYLKNDEASERKKLVCGFFDELGKPLKAEEETTVITKQILPGIAIGDKLIVPVKYWISSIVLSILLLTTVTLLGIFNIKNFKTDNLGDISVSTNIPGSILRLDGKQIYRFKEAQKYTIRNIFRGTHKITIDAGDFYTRHTAIVFVEPSKKKIINLPLIDKAKLANLSVWSSQKGVNTIVNKEKGKDLPAKWTTSPGQIEIAAELRNFHPISESISLDIHEDRHLLLEMLNNDRDVLRLDYKKKPVLFNFKMGVLRLLESIRIIKPDINDPRFIEKIIPE